MSEGGEIFFAGGYALPPREGGAGLRSEAQDLMSGGRQNRGTGSIRGEILKAFSAQVA